jgi:hypothetical protein
MREGSYSRYGTGDRKLTLARGRRGSRGGGDYGGGGADEERRG